MMAEPWKRREVIGDCTLYLGDSLEVSDVIGRVGALVTDPPYGMAFRSNHRNEKHKKIANDRDAGMLKWACQYPVRHSRYVFCRWDNLVEVPKPRSLVTWVKNNWSMGDLNHEHARQTEVALFYAGEEHAFPVGRPSDVISVPRTGNTHHPTEKPEPLMTAVIQWTAGLVFDPFMGSGTTGVACARLGRPFVGVEVDEGYFDIACERIRQAYEQTSLFNAPPSQAASPAFCGDFFGGGET